jgi:protoheme IX farnesyltransferase
VSTSRYPSSARPYLPVHTRAQGKAEGSAESEPDDSEREERDGRAAEIESQRAGWKPGMLMRSPAAPSTDANFIEPVADCHDARRGQVRALVAPYLALTKPNIVVMCLTMTAAGMWLAPGSIGWLTVLWTLVGTALAIGAANALNMLLERDIDAKMSRTKGRPLPTGQLTPRAAATFGAVCGVASIAMLWPLVNLATALLAAFAMASYVWVYTPLKRKTHWAMHIGTIPGAMPPLLGWTAVTGSIELPGIALFAILVLWQVPHFIAIALYRKADYTRGGIKALPVVRGDRAARRHALVTAALLIPVSLALLPLGVVGWAYAIPVLAGGLFFLGVGLWRMTERGGLKGARQFFFASLIFLPALGVGLMANLLVQTLSAH